MRKGQLTRERIIEQALAETSVRGLAALTIGQLAERLAMSKSGLIAHFGSLEQLQREVIARAFALFGEHVARPAMAVPRGKARLLALFDRWAAWACAPERPGGCPVAGAIFDFDGIEGALKQDLAAGMEQLRRTLRTIVIQAQAVDLDPQLEPEDIVSMMIGLSLGQHVERWLLGDMTAPARARALLARHLGATPAVEPAA